MLLKPQAESLLFAAVLLLLQPIQTEVVDPVFQIVGLTGEQTERQTNKQSNATENRIFLAEIIIETA